MSECNGCEVKLELEGVKVEAAVQLESALNAREGSTTFQCNDE